MRLSGQFPVCFFFYENNLSVKKALKPKTNNFLPLRSFCAQKIVAFVVFCSLIFVSLVDFGLFGFCAFKIFS